jgi:phospholipase/carboxylesterase
MKGYSWDPRTDSLRLAKEIEKLKQEKKVDGNRVYLMGFSAGANMAYLFGIKHPEWLSGLVPFGGSLQREALSAQDLEKAAGVLPVFIVHGKADQVMPFGLAKKAKEILEKAGFKVDGHTFDGGHELPPEHEEVIKRAIAWIEKARKTGK